MKKLSSIILFLFLLSFSLLVCAQTGKFYSTDRDLSNSLINKVYQDRKGFIWIATENGLNRFDGIHFSVYRHNTTDSTSLKNNYVRSLYEDSHGNFWIGCINGLQRYDRATNSFSEISLYRDNKVIAPHITAIIERSNGEVWMSTSGQGVISIKMNKERTDYPFDVTLEHSLSEKLSSPFLNTIYEDSKRNLWIAAEGKGVFRYTPETGKLKHFKAEQGLLNNDVSSICEDFNGNIFVGTLTGGLYMLENQKGNSAEKFHTILYNNKANLNIKTLMRDGQGIIYIGTDGEGLKKYQPERNNMVDCEVNTAPFDFSKSKIHTILQDRDNNLWIGIFQKGIILIPGTLNRFDYYGYKSIRKNTIGSSCVMSIHADKQGGIWVGTDNDGLYAINETGDRSTHYEHRPDRAFSVPGTIMAIEEIDDKYLMIGSYFNGLAKVDKRTGHCEYLPLNSAEKNVGANEKVSCIIKDNGNLWIGTYGSGIHKIRLSDYTVTRYESTRNENNDWSIDRLPNDWINCILKSSSGLIWIGTYKGVSCFNPKENTFINYTGKNNLLPGYIVYSLLESTNGMIWIGTAEGLFSFNTASEQFTHFTTDNGLPSDVICAMEEDKNGNIWISTHHGLSKLLVKEQKFINYYSADGLQGNEFSRNAVYKDRNGKLYFGGISGITAFDPEEITDLKKKPEIVITDFYLANRIIKKGDTSGNNVITDVSIMDATHLTFAYNENTFGFEFSALEFGNPERITYQYKIDELGSDWISTYSGVNRVTFSNLNPGKYTFRVRASDHENFSDIRTVHILITPPWYETLWATLLWVILTCILLYAIVMYILSRFRHKQELLEMEHQEQINEAKLQFFINISHEIRTPMTLIISPLEQLLAENNSEKQSTYLTIYRNAQRILRLINQLMDIRKLDKGQMHLKYRETDIVGFIDDVMQTFKYQAQKRNINFTFNHKDKELKAWIDLNNFDKVVLNVLSNAFKYTPEGGEISVELTSGTDENIKGALKKYIEISITDNGIGISKDKVEQIFERFYQINNDLTQSNFGTGIGLHLSRSLVELHQGSIKAENREEGSGTRFIIRLPMGCDHLKLEDLENPESVTKNQISKERKKPVLPEHLIETEKQDADAKRIKAKTPYKILIIEDDDEIRKYISDELCSEFRIIECTNGKEGLEQTFKENPDLVISDVMMPEMDGITFSKKVKQNINISHIPIILLTAKSQAEDRIEGLETGADAYIVKPFNLDLLRTTVSNLINNRERLKSKFSNEKIVEEHIAKVEKRSSDDILMEKIIKTINNNLDNPELNVDMLATSAGLSRVHMYRKLKKLTNQSTRDFIRNIRLKQAATLLVEKELAISDIAYTTGFNNLPHFSVAFKELYGMSPTEYREQKKSDKQSSL